METLDVWASLGWLGTYNPWLESLIFPRGSLDCDRLGAVVYLNFDEPRLSELEKKKRWWSTKRWVRSCNWQITQDGDVEGCFRIPAPPIVIQDNVLCDVGDANLVILLNVLGIR